MHGNKGSENRLVQSFEAGMALLKIFSASSTMLESLQAQFTQHEQFDKDRLAKLRWRKGDNYRQGLIRSRDAQTVLAQKCFHSIAVLKNCLKWKSGNRHLIAAFIRLESAKKLLVNKIIEENQLGHGVSRLQVRSFFCYCVQTVMFCLMNPCWQNVKAAIQKILNSGDPDTLADHFENPRHQAQEAINFLHFEEATLMYTVYSAEAKLSAALPSTDDSTVNEQLKQLRSQKLQIRTLLKRLNELRPPKSQTCIEPSDSFKSVTSFLLDRGRNQEQYSIACLLILSRKLALIRAMLSVSPWFQLYVYYFFIFVVSGVLVSLDGSVFSSLPSLLWHLVPMLSLSLLVACSSFYVANPLFCVFFLTIHSWILKTFNVLIAPVSEWESQAFSSYKFSPTLQKFLQSLVSSVFYTAVFKLGTVFLRHFPSIANCFLPRKDQFRELYCYSMIPKSFHLWFPCLLFHFLFGAPSSTVLLHVFLAVTLRHVPRQAWSYNLEKKNWCKFLIPIMQSLQSIAARTDIHFWVPGLLFCLLFGVRTLQMDQITFHRLLLMCHFHLACN